MGDINDNIANLEYEDFGSMCGMYNCKLSDDLLDLYVEMDFWVTNTFCQHSYIRKFLWNRREENNAQRELSNYIIIVT